MQITSTCRDCGGPLPITNNETTHPHCTPKPTKAENLAQQWLAAVLNDDTNLELQLHTKLAELDNRPPRLKAAALQYARWGWAVFPIKEHTKRPATRHGFHDATTDLDRITAWWDRHPTDNIGLPTGHQFDVIDVDVPEGIGSLIKLQTANFAAHGRVTTSSGGVHFYIEPRGKPNGVRLMPGVDYRGLGGYVVAPPSTLGSPGRAWTWTHTPSPTITTSGQHD